MSELDDSTKLSRSQRHQISLAEAVSRAVLAKVQRIEKDRDMPAHLQSTMETENPQPLTNEEYSELVVFEEIPRPPNLYPLATPDELPQFTRLLISWVGRVRKDLLKIEKENGQLQKNRDERAALRQPLMLLKQCTLRLFWECCSDEGSPVNASGGPSRQSMQPDTLRATDCRVNTEAVNTDSELKGGIEHRMAEISDRLRSLNISHNKFQADLADIKAEIGKQLDTPVSSQNHITDNFLHRQVLGDLPVEIFHDYRSKLLTILRNDKEDARMDVHRLLGGPWRKIDLYRKKEKLTPALMADILRSLPSTCRIHLDSLDYTL